MSLLIRGGRVLDPASGLDCQADVLIAEGRIARIDRGIASAATVIEAAERLVVPGLVDMHVHLREPGEEHKEDIGTGSAAAAAGGFTTICCMPNTKPVNDAPAVTEGILRRARQVNVVRIRPIGAISCGLAGKQLCDYAELKAAGIVAISDDGHCIMDAGLMRRALERANTVGLPTIQHCEDENLSARGAMNEGVNAARAGLSAQPAEAESVILARDLELVRATGARYHMAHVSTAAALRILRWGKSQQLPVTCEAMPHHFTLSDAACLGRDPATKVNPPLRSVEDVEALKQALADGTVEVIATDHAPHSVREKEVSYELAAYGISGLETAVPLCLALWRDGVVTLERLVALLTVNPSRILGLNAGTLAPGAAADVTVIDPDCEWTVNPALFRSKGHNTPFAGHAMRGAVTHTVVEGRVVYERPPQEK